MRTTEAPRACQNSVQVRWLSPVRMFKRCYHQGAAVEQGGIRRLGSAFSEPLMG